MKPKRCRGSEILFRVLEETNISKLLNITAGAFLIDQAEELNAGEAGEQIFGTPLERLSDPSGLLGLPLRSFAGPATCDDRFGSFRKASTA
jgi:hypothetical protein